MSETFHVRHVKGSELKEGDHIWHGDNFYRIKELLPLEIIFHTFRIAYNYNNIIFLVHCSIPESKP